MSNVHIPGAESMSLSSTSTDASGSPTLPVVTPRGSYRLLRRHGDLIFISGQGPLRPDGTFHVGKVGGDVKTSDAYQHARLVGRLILSTLEESGVDLGQIEVMKVLGLVNAVCTFAEHPAVINGCSDYLIEQLGERGEHARSAIGVGSLPHNMTVEIEAIFSVIH
jgi:enamine deaminase RidA (YjgF/YER057c/UK114 family)